MTGIDGITAGLTSLKLAMDVAKAIKSTDSAFVEAEYKAKAAELLSTLADVKSDFVDAKERIIALEKQVKDLNEKLKTKVSMNFESPFYWTTKDGKKDGPYCPTCWDREQKPIRVFKISDGYHRCNVCKNNHGSGSKSSPKYRG